MDSINKQQPEHNTEHLSGTDAVKKIRELVKSAGTGFFCTRLTAGGMIDTRPMGPEEIDEQGNFWFLSADDSNKNRHIAEDPKVQLFFQGSAHSDFLTLYGSASISRDKEKIKKLWDPLMKTWFTEGEDDPRITVIKFTPEDGYYWDTKHGNAVAFAKIAFGALTGQTYDDSVEGTIKP